MSDRFEYAVQGERDEELGRKGVPLKREKIRAK